MGRLVLTMKRQRRRLREVRVPWMRVQPGASLLLACVMLFGGIAAAAQGAALCTPQVDHAVTVEGTASLADALAAAPCGTTILLAAGDYGGDFEASQICSASDPLVLRAAEPQAATLTGQLRLFGAHLVVSGLTVDRGEIVIRGGPNRVTRTLFLTPGSLEVRSTSSSRIDHNEFATPAVNGVDIAFKFSKDDKLPARDNLVDHNLFRSRTAPAEAGGEDDDDDERHSSIGIYLGQFSARKGRQYMLDYGHTGTIIENNLFYDYWRRKAIHVKSLGNTIRNNTFMLTDQQNRWSRVTIRHGQYNVLSANLVDGTTGLQIFEEHNSALGNVLLNGATLAVMGGGGEETQFGGRQQREAVDTLVAGNSGPLSIGVTYRRRPNKTPATDTVVEGHDGPIETLLEQRTVIRDAAGDATARASRLGLEQVGLKASDPRCPKSSP
jgi:hypothetical protein